MANYILRECDPVIYPIKAWVVKGGTKQDIKDLFVDGEDSEELIITDALIESSKAITIEPVKLLKDGQIGTLVWVHHPDRLDVGTLAHEADHAANAIFKQIGAKVDVENDETHAYLVGFIADCIWQVKNNN